MPRGSVAGCVLGLSIATAASTATASDPIDWEAPTPCPTADELRNRITRYVQRPLRDTERGRARGRVSQTMEGFRLDLRIEVDGASPVRRVLRDADCQVLGDAAALMIAMALEPDATARAIALGVTPRDAVAVAPPPTPPGSPAPAAPPPEPTPKATPPVPAKPPSCRPGPSLLRRPRSERDGLRPPCGSLGARVGVQFGPLPGVGPGVGGYFHVLWPRLALELSAMHWFEKKQRLDDAPELGGDLRLTAAAALGCGRLGVATAEFPLCLGAELGALRGTGVGVDRPQEDRLLWAAMLATAGVGWSPLERFAMFARVEAIVPFARYRFEVANLGSVYEPPPVGVRGQLGLELRLR